MEPTQARIELVREGGTIRMGGTDVSMEDMARMLGVFAAIVAAEAVKRGMGVEEVKDAMLDIFLAATAAWMRSMPPGHPGGTYLGYGIRRRKQWNTSALQARAGSTSP